MQKHISTLQTTLTSLLLLLPTHTFAATQITQHGITWTFERETQTGKFANGDFWVLGPVTITSIKNTYHTHGFSPSQGQDGSMINPPTSEQQGYENHLTSYNPSLNVSHPRGHPISPSNPLTLPVDASLISTVSWLYTSPNQTEPGCPRFNSATGTPRPALRTAAILTCLKSAPPEGSFRPPYCGTDKTIRFNQLDLHQAPTLLKTLPPVANTPALADLEKTLERPWIDHVHAWMGAYLHPSEHQPEYGRDHSILFGKVALMLHLDFTQLPNQPSKKDLLIRFIQIGIDITGIADNGGSWPSDGGHSMGRKWPILFAGLLLNDPHMKNVGSWKTAFQEDHDTFYVSQTEVTATQSNTWNPDTRNATTPYNNKNIGLPEWGIRHRSAPQRDNLHWEATYRAINNQAYPGWVLAAIIMGQKKAWNHPALFDYIDRSTTNGLDKSTKPHLYAQHVFGGKFIQNMWKTYRKDYGCIWTPNNPENFYSLGERKECP